MNYDTLLSVVKAEFSSFKVVYKTDSWLMRAIAFLLFFNKGFTTSFVTTIGNTMYVPTKWSEWPDLLKERILRHERVHLRQQVRYGFLLYSFLYLFFPLPVGLAWFRARLEWEAYSETLRTIARREGVAVLLGDEVRAYYIRYFTSGDYGWMWPFPKQVGKWYDQLIEQLRVTT